CSSSSSTTYIAPPYRAGRLVSRRAGPGEPLEECGVAVGGVAGTVQVRENALEALARGRCRLRRHGAGPADFDEAGVACGALLQFRYSGPGGQFFDHGETSFSGSNDAY